MSDILFFFIGIIIGAIAGIVPALHPNFISTLLLFQNIEYDKKAILIVSVYAAHLVFSYIPSIFFGVPHESTAVSVLPGHRMVREGNGMLALKTMVVSTLVGAIASCLLIPVALEFYPFAYLFVKPYILHILLIASVIFIVKTKNPIYSGLIFVASGILGAYTLKTGMPDVFLPLFSGLFAMGAIMNYKKSEIPVQKDVGIGIGILKYTLLGVLLGGLANLIPAISSAAQVAALASLFTSFETPYYLATVAAINVGQFVFALASSVSIEKARHGVIVNLAQIVNIGENMNMLIFYFLAGTALSGLAVFLLRKKISVLANFDYSKFNKVLAVYLLLIIFMIDGLHGVGVFALASLIGYITIKLNVERTIMMGALILPILLLLASKNF